MLFKRLIQPRVEKALFRGKAVIIYGARRVGKTTLVAAIRQKYPNSLYLNCDEPDVRLALTDKTSTELAAYLRSAKLVVLDEAQRVKNIGLTIKLLVDNFPEIQILATGSSAFELSNRIKEPLTGRVSEFYLYPLAAVELLQTYPPIEFDRILENRLIYGSYPEILKGRGKPEIEIQRIATSYLYKDALEYQRIKNPELVERLISALALQIGQEVSYTELSGILGVDKKTIASYLRILEAAFVIFRLPSFARNARKEIRASRKIYFWDNGIRNALIRNFNPLTLRNDVGNLWENFLMAERFKLRAIYGREAKIYFWRTWQQVEIDCIEDQNGKLSAYEFKWGNKLSKAPKVWRETYPEAIFSIINRGNYQDFIAGNIEKI